MIASQKIGRSFMGALNYNLKKLNHPDPEKRAELLETNFSSLDAKQIRQEIELVRELRPNLGRYVYHTSLNFSKDDLLQNLAVQSIPVQSTPVQNPGIQNSALLTIAHQYLQALGFTNNQYFIFRHYDAEHPHLHLLVNRICFDGKVVSDSNNYKRSEKILRDIEVQYNLVPVEHSNKVAQRAACKDELEMVMRTGKPSEKMLLQELLKNMLKQKNLTLTGFIAKGEQAGIRFLFNQSSTGRVSGITYFHNGFKIKGQTLGNSFKWTEIIKKIAYEQTRDSAAISAANSRTTAAYGELAASTGPAAGNDRSGADELFTGNSEDTGYFGRESAAAFPDGSEDRPGRERTLEADQDADIPVDYTADFGYSRFDGFNIQIADDKDDAKKRRRGMGYGR